MVPPSAPIAAAGGPPPPPGSASQAGGPPPPPGAPPPPPTAPHPAATAGSFPSPSAPYQATATYYGIDDLAQTGAAMACGAPFDPLNVHSAATNDWPCGTKLHVSAANGKSVDVVVADHGAYPQHWIDLTYSAFGMLADHSVGEMTVTVQLSQ
jgi:rare lipoprotein A (peptidoglycan hydrolase)